jgi:DeoR family fructose operon transcriptional repressor
LLAHERHSQILALLEEQGSVKVESLVKLFGVSTETIRRDLEFLEKRGSLTRVYGGAVLEKINDRQLVHKNRIKENIEQKKEIARIAVSLLSDEQTIALNSSTTNLEIAKLIKNKNKLSKLTVLTNSVLIANELIQNSNCSVFLTGGFFKRDEFSLAGPLATNNISQFFVDIAFISVSGISLRAGITDYDMDELPVQKEMISIAQKVIILADSSKFCSRSLLKVTDLDKANAIITDSNLEESVYQEFLSNGINLIKQEPNQTSPPTTRRAK